MPKSDILEGSEAVQFLQRVWSVDKSRTGIYVYYVVVYVMKNKPYFEIGQFYHKQKGKKLEYTLSIDYTPPQKKWGWLPFFKTPPKWWVQRWFIE